MGTEKIRENIYTFQLSAAVQSGYCRGLCYRRGYCIPLRQDWGTDLRPRASAATLQCQIWIINKQLNTSAVRYEPCVPAFIVISLGGTVILVSELLQVASYKITAYCTDLSLPVAPPVRN